MDPTTGKSHWVVVNGGGISNSVINVHFNGKDRRAATAAPANDKTTGDHSIVVDASALPGSSGGGIRNSTLNLTVISRRALAELAHAMRSLFSPALDRTREERDDETMAGPRLRLVRDVLRVDLQARRSLAPVTAAATTTTADEVPTSNDSPSDASPLAASAESATPASPAPTSHLSKRVTGTTLQRRKVVVLVPEA